MVSLHSYPYSFIEIAIFASPICKRLLIGSFFVCYEAIFHSFALEGGVNICYTILFRGSIVKDDKKWLGASWGETMNKKQEAIQLIQAGQIKEGLEKLTQWEKVATDEEQYEILEIYMELGLTDRAERLIQKWKKSGKPFDGELITMEAEIKMEHEEEEEAISLLSQIRKEDPAFLKAQLLLADIYQLQGLDEVAEQKLQYALSLAPEEPVIVAAMGYYYMERGDYKKCIPYFKKAEQLGFVGQHDNIKLHLAQAYSATGEFETALDYYEKGLKEREDLDALFGYGYTALQLHDYERAIEPFTRLKELDPEYVTLYPYLVRAHKQLHNYEQALNIAKEGLSYDEFNDTLFMEAAMLYDLLGEKDKVSETMWEAISLNPTNSEAILYLLRFFREEEDEEAIIELMSHLKELGESDPLYAWFEAYAWREQEEDEKARQAYEQANIVYGQDPEFLEDYGRFLLEIGNRKQALQLFEQSLQLQPENEPLRNLMEELTFW